MPSNTAQFIAIAILTVLITSCAAPINRRTAANYYQAGQAAAARGDLVQARELFSRALINARLGEMGPVAEAEALMGLGRVQGNLCDYDAADKSFIEARDLLTKGVPKTPMAALVARVELAQLAYDTGRYDRAASYFEEAFANGGSRLKEGDPAMYVAIARDYADALSKTGRAEQSKQLLSDISTVSVSSGSAKLGKADDYVPYPKTCK